MFHLSPKKDEQYTDVTAAEARHEYIIPEEFPEGPYGSSTNRNLGKSTPWEKDQKTHKAFSYEYEKQYEETEQQYPEASTETRSVDTNKVKSI
ncbi:hypothetical protein H9I32_16070 [Bacillus sp. Xin]|uniref:hypothetical protein n=1 Tax=unclassified Bacillus (in: firmicutes) TaxID=185979 RepID=UPI001571B3BB|nr:MULTISPECIES: hypothetical protein [unclassified Bacillus (in: firmicutes)]MBC6973817.1 hypothetical protein [Bacillus sp. Xin]NSW36040.1 hypothetical protein [Bacillus sp. Xin1]